jgi:hypothetical protein
MPYSSHRKSHSMDRALVMFEVAFNPITTKWSVFCEDTLTVFSEHETEQQAHAACRRYVAAAWRRLITRPLADLAHRAI